MKDLLKLLILLGLYLGLAPMLGRWAAQHWQRVRWLFTAMLFLPVLPPGKFTLFFQSVEFYRGHTKGFEGNLIEVLAIAIITASALTRHTGWKRIGPGAPLYLLYCAAGALSLLPALQYSPLYASMALVKFTKASLMLLGAYHFLRAETDLRHALRALCYPLLYNGFLAVQAKLTGVWQFKGTFEHQNPMAMWVYLTALPLLSTALHPSTERRDYFLQLSAVAAGGLAILLSVSRAGLAIYAAGAAAILLLAWIRGPRSARLVSLTTASAVGAVLVLCFAFGSFTARMNEAKASAETSELDLRDVLNLQARAMLADSPLGIGWNCFGVANSRPYGTKYSNIIEDWDASRGFTFIEDNYIINPLTESLYWLHLAETGYPGFLTYAAFQACTLWFAVRVLRHYRHSLPGAFATGLLVALSLCYAHGLVERILTQTKNLSAWLLLCGLLLALEQRRRLQLLLSRKTPTLSAPQLQPA